MDATEFFTYLFGEAVGPEIAVVEPHEACSESRPAAGVAGLEERSEVLASIRAEIQLHRDIHDPWLRFARGIIAGARLTRRVRDQQHSEHRGRHRHHAARTPGAP